MRLKEEYKFRTFKSSFFIEKIYVLWYNTRHCFRGVIMDLNNISIDELLEVLDSDVKDAEIKKKKIEEIKETIKPSKIKVEDIYQIKEEKKEVVSSNDDFEDMVKKDLEKLKKLKKYTKENILDILPSIDNYNFDRVLCRIIAEYTKEMKEIREFIITDGNDFNKQDLEVLKEEILDINNKRDILIEILNTTYEESNEELEESNKLIFVPIKGSGKIRALEDVKDIPQEEYEEFIELFESIKNGTFKGFKRFVNNNSLNGALEVRGFQKRILYQRLSEDCYAIISMFIKKAQNVRGYQQQLKYKYSEYKELEKELKEKVRDPKFIEENQNYEDELFGILGKSKGESK